MGRRGFTLIELMLSLVLLSIVLVSLAQRTGIFQTVSGPTVRTAAVEVARERIGPVDMVPSHTTLGTTWAGTQSGSRGSAQIQRVTTVQR
jgi:prepilin-type N-terminal cleavage/methylation domain-containing protein